MATHTARIELISGVAASVLGLLFWAIWLFAPLHPVNVGSENGMQVVYTSQVDNTHGPNNPILLPLLILAFMLVTAAVAYGAYLHVRRSEPEGRLVVWGGTILTLLLLSTLRIQVPVSPVAGLDVQVQSLALGLSVVLAIIASVAAIGVEDVRRQASW